MEKAMKIKITEGSGWYEDKVGEIFEVNEESSFDGSTIYFTDPPEYTRGEGRRYVQGEECEIVDEDSPNEESPNMVEQTDVVNSPPHYNFGSIEVIDFIDQVADGYSGRQAYLAGNIIKYVSRAPYKNGPEDAKKAAWYLERLINEMSAKEDE